MIVASALSIAFAIFKQLDEDSEKSTKWSAPICHVVLSDGGTLNFAEMAYEVLSWHFGFEDLVVAALDMGAKTRCAMEGTRAVSADAMKIDYYLGTKLYDPNLDIERVECSCTDQIINRLKNNKNVQMLNNDVRCWKSNSATLYKGIPAVFAYADCSKGYISRQDVSYRGKILRNLTPSLANSKQQQLGSNAILHRSPNTSRWTVRSTRNSNLGRRMKRNCPVRIDMELDCCN